MQRFQRFGRPRPRFGSAVPFLQMDEEEYAEVLRAHGYGERFIAKELAALREARQRHDLPGPPTKDEEPGEDEAERLAKKRREG